MGIMTKLLMSAAFIVGLATSAYAGVVVAPTGDNTGVSITRVAEGCGPDRWRDDHGHCHPMAHDRVCPRGYHLGPEGHRCWPD
jgi:hypothetical protein